MKYSEAKKAVEALSSKYYINMEDDDFIVNYKSMLVAWVKNNKRYLLYNNENNFKKIPFSNKLYMILAELAITPLNERVDDKKYYVKVCDSISGYLNINTVTGKMLMMVGSAYGTEFVKTKFTIKEIEQLKQREDVALDWNKVHLEEAD